MRKKITQGKWRNTLSGIKYIRGLLIAQCWYGQNSNAEGHLDAVPSYEEFVNNSNAIALIPEMIETLEALKDAFIMLEGANHAITKTGRELIDNVLGKLRGKEQEHCTNFSIPATLKKIVNLHL